MVCFCVAVDLSQLDRDVSSVIGMAWAQNTKSVRNSQWKKFLTFCGDNELTPIPAEPNTIARFLVYIARSVKYSTVNNHLSAIIKLHQYYGYSANFRDAFLIQLVLKGIKRQIGDTSVHKIPLTPQQLLAIYDKMDMKDPYVHALWTGIVFSFRTLLRKSNILPDSASKHEHVLRRSDITTTSSGLMVRVHSTKTLQYKERVLEIPVETVRGSPLCAVTLLCEHFSMFPMHQDSFLLYKQSGKGLIPIVYKELLDFIKSVVPMIGLNPNDVGFHSMRHSGAAHLHSIGIPLEDIRCVGDWRSLAVLTYLITPLDRKCAIENRVANSLKELN